MEAAVGAREFNTSVFATRDGGDSTHDGTNKCKISTVVIAITISSNVIGAQTAVVCSN